MTSIEAIDYVLPLLRTQFARRSDRLDSLPAYEVEARERLERLLAKDAAAVETLTALREYIADR